MNTYGYDPVAATLTSVSPQETSTSRLLPSTSNISLLSLSFSGAEPEQFAINSVPSSTMDTLEEEQDPLKGLGKQQQQSQILSSSQLQQQQQMFKATPSSYSANQYMSAAQQRRVGHYINSMGPSSRPGSRCGSYVNLMGSSPGNLSTSYSGSFVAASSGSYMGAPMPGQAIPQPSRSRRASYTSYSASPTHFSPGSFNSMNGINGMLAPDSPNLGPISLCNSPTKMFLTQTPPVGMKNGSSSLSRGGSSTSLYQQHQQQLFYQHLQQQQQQQQINQQNQQLFQQHSKDVNFPISGEHTSIFNVLENTTVPPKQSGISKAFSQHGGTASTITTSSSTSSHSASASGDNDSGPLGTTRTAYDDNKVAGDNSSISTNFTRDPPPLRSLKSMMELHENNTSQVNTKDQVKSDDCVNNGLKGHKQADNTHVENHNNSDDNEQELREKQKVSKTAAAITAALNSEILKNEEKERKIYAANNLKGSNNAGNTINSANVIDNGSKGVSSFLNSRNNNNDQNNVLSSASSSSSTSASNRQEIPSYLHGKVLGASSTPIAIPASGNSKSSRSQKNNCDKEEQNRENQTDDDDEDDEDDDNGHHSHRNGNQEVEDCVRVKGSTNLGASIDPTSALHHAGSASNMRALMSPTSARHRHRQSQLSLSNLSSHIASGLNLSATSPSNSSIGNTGTRVYANHNSGIPPQLIATTIDENSDLVSPLVPNATHGSGTAVLTSNNINNNINTNGLNMSSSVSSLSSMMLNPSTPDSPGLYPISMTPFEAGLMTPMTLDPLSSRHASLASVDNFFRPDMMPISSAVGLMNQANSNNVGVVGNVGLVSNVGNVANVGNVNSFNNFNKVNNSVSGMSSSGGAGSERGSTSSTSTINTDTTNTTATPTSASTSTLNSAANSATSIDTDTNTHSNVNANTKTAPSPLSSSLTPSTGSTCSLAIASTTNASNTPKPLAPASNEPSNLQQKLQGLHKSVEKN